jgi:peptidoglycan/LPS O-acetylase OafA/YrhL
VTALAYTCPSRYGPHPCGVAEFWVWQSWAWLLFGLVLLGVACWVYAWAYEKWINRPAARRRRALAELDRKAAERERAARPPVEVPEAFRRRTGQPW